MAMSNVSGKLASDASLDMGLTSNGTVECSCEVSGNRTPRHRDIHLLCGYGANQIRGRIGFRQIAEDAVAYQIARQSAAGERLDWRQAAISCRRGRVLPSQMTEAADRRES